MKTKCYMTWAVFSLLSFDGAASTPERAVPQSTREMDYSALPSDADFHHRTKWSNGVYIYIDDDIGAPSLYIFDRSGRPIAGALILIPSANRVRIQDFAAASDGTVWASGNAISTSGQMIYFLARIKHGGVEAQIIQTTPYRATQLAVAPDETVWTIGADLTIDANGKPNPLDPAQHILRHFDTSGRMIGSGVPLSTANMLRCFNGYLVATPDRLGWYAPASGSGTYVEFSPDMKVIHSYPTPPLATRYSTTWGFTLTPAGNAFVMVHATEDKDMTVFYKLDRTAKAWVAVEGVPASPTGLFPMLEGNDGESLIFMGPPNKSKLQIVNVTQ